MTHGTQAPETKPGERAATHAPKTELPKMTPRHASLIRYFQSLGDRGEEANRALDEIRVNNAAQVSGEAKLVPTAGPFGLRAVRAEIARCQRELRSYSTGTTGRHVADTLEGALKDMDGWLTPEDER